MKNFLIIVLAMGLAGSAFLTRPDREEFNTYLHDRQAPLPTDSSLDRIRKEVTSREKVEGVEFKDFYLWTVVKKDGKTLYTGVFDHWVDNEQVRRCLPS